MNVFGATVIKLIHLIKKLYWTFPQRATLDLCSLLQTSKNNVVEMIAETVTDKMQRQRQTGGVCIVICSNTITDDCDARGKT